MDIKSRLLTFIEALGIKRSEFAQAISVTQGNVSDWVNRKKSSKPSSPAMARISEIYNLNLNWLITGKGEMFLQNKDGMLREAGNDRALEELSGSSAVFQHKLSPFESRILVLPIFGDIAAGLPVESHDVEALKYVEIPKAYLFDQENTYLALKVSGNSMSPQIMNDDIVVIHKRFDIVNLNGRICACQTPDGITLKKIQFDEVKKRVILKPLNQDYDVIILEEAELESFRILGEMALQFRVFR